MLEPWITPSLFEQWRTAEWKDTAIDETTFNERLGKEEAKKQLEKHWSTWVTEEDFKKIKIYGLDAVRIPFSWWIINPTDKISGLAHLDRGMELAKKYGIKVLLDLHGAPLSQNGFDNSGLACADHYPKKDCHTKCPAEYRWSMDADKGYESLKITTETLKKIALRYKNYDNVWGLELLNEPFFKVDLKILQKWYTGTYNELRTIVPNWNIIMHDSFRPYSWDGFMTDKTKYTNVWRDTHIYWAFREDIMRNTTPGILKDTCNAINQIKKEKNSWNAFNCWRVESWPR